MKKCFCIIFACCLSVLSAIGQRTLQQDITGSWVRTLTTTDEHSGTSETQRSVRTFALDGTLKEEVIYEEEVRDNSDETVVFSFVGTIEGKWVCHGNDILISYNGKTLKVAHLDTRFPEHDDALQGSLRRAFDMRNKAPIKNYLITIKNVLRGYYKRNSGSALRGVEIHGDTMTATLGKEIVAFIRTE